MYDNTEKNIQINFLHIKNNFNITNKSETNELDYIDYTDLCIICWSANGKTILCINWNFKYCDDCVKKIDNKCCICYRNSNKYNYINNYDDDDGDDDEYTIYYIPYFHTTLLEIIYSIIMFLTAFIGIMYIFITIVIKIIT